MGEKKFTIVEIIVAIVITIIIMLLFWESDASNLRVQCQKIYLHQRKVLKN